jgi:hypothetical protein
MQQNNNEDIPPTLFEEANDSILQKRQSESVMMTDNLKLDLKKSDDKQKARVSSRIFEEGLPEDEDILRGLFKG